MGTNFSYSSVARALGLIRGENGILRCYGLLCFGEKCINREQCGRFRFRGLGSRVAYGPSRCQEFIGQRVLGITGIRKGSD